MVDGENTIRDGFEDAWGTGALQCGIYSGEFTDDEMVALEIETNLEISHLGGFADAIQTNSKANEGALQPLLNRADAWAQSYNRIVSRANVMACADQKLRWEYGDTIDHCDDCAQYEGRVYRGSVWDAAGVYPKSHDLQCFGIWCDCKQVPTTERITPGKVPALIGHKHLHVH